MSSTLLEQTRSYHEEKEWLEKISVEDLLDDPKTVRTSVLVPSYFFFGLFFLTISSSTKNTFNNNIE